MLPPRASVDLGVMAIKGCSAFPKAPALQEPNHKIVQCYIQDTRCGESYLTAEMQSVYSTAPADWAKSRVYACISLSLSIYIYIYVAKREPQFTVKCFSNYSKLLVNVSSQQCSSLNGLDSSFDFQSFQSSFQPLVHRSNCIDYNSYHRHPNFPQFFFYSLARSKYLSNFFLLIYTRGGWNEVFGLLLFYFW